MKKNIFWVASYPKSGNTWMRAILTYLFFRERLKTESSWVKDLGYIPDMYKFKKKDDIYNAPEFKWKERYISLVKTHNYNLPYQENKDIEIVGFVYVYRHPLDVLLSAINFNFIINNSNFFYNGKPKSVDELKVTGELNLYVDDFIKNNLQINIWQKMSNNWINHVTHWLNISKTLENTIVIKYEDLLNNTFEEVTKFKTVFDIEDTEIIEAINYSQQKTNDGKSFFWKKQSRNYENYIEQEKIILFKNKYSDILKNFGYGDSFDET